MSVFISYNHKDQPTALKIRDALTAAGIDVIIDVEKMQSGQNIRQFILECVKGSGVTLSLVSANSLLSAWVAMETITSNVDVELRRRRFIPAYIDPSFMDRSFTSQAMERIEKELLDIEGHMRTAIDKRWGIEDLQEERTRYRNLCAALPEIVGQLRESLCIDLTPEHFDAGMQKIIADLKKENTTQPPSIKEDEAQSPSVKAQATKAIDDIQNQVSGILDEASRQRLESISKRLQTLRSMLEKYEEELDFETDPKRQMRYEREIANTKTAIQKILDEMKELDTATT